MVAALLLRLTLSGALEAMPDSHPVPEFYWVPSLKELASRALKNLGGDRISSAEIKRASSYLNRPMESLESMIIQAMRVALLAIGWLAKKPASPGRKKRLPLMVGYGLLAEKEIHLGVCGQPSSEFLKDLLGEVNRDLSDRGQVVSLGDFIPLDGSYLPCVCTSGEAELVLSSGKINLLIAGPGTDPSLVELCHTLDIPSASYPDSISARALVQRSKENRNVAIRPNFNPPLPLVEEAEVAIRPSDLEESFKKGPSRKMALLGGADHLYHPLGWVPTEVTPALRAKGIFVSAWGDAALWMVKQGLASPQNRPPVQILDGQQGPVLALKALGASGRLRNLKGVCFTGMKSCQDLATALGLATMGLRVSLAVPIPLWGSEKVRNLLQEKLAAVGGSLTHFDHPAQAEEILDWFLKN
jgi:hypothetical protein